MLKEKPTSCKYCKLVEQVQLLIFIMLFTIVSLIASSQAGAETIDDISPNTFIQGSDIYNLDSTNLTRANVLKSYQAGGTICLIRSPFAPNNWYTMVGGTNIGSVDATSRSDISGVNADVKKLSSAQLNAIPLRFWYKSAAVVERVPLRSDAISVANNPSTTDYIDITGIFPGDVIKVYDAATGGNLIGQGTVASGQYSIQLSIAQLGIKAGSVYITVASTFSAQSYESTRKAKAYEGEPTIKPATPINLVAVTGNSAVSLSWDAVDGATGYMVYRSLESNANYVVIANNISAVTYNSTGLDVGKRYYYKVTSRMSNAESDLSEAATAVANVDELGNIYIGDRLLVSNQNTVLNSESTGTLSVAETVEMNMVPADLELEAYRIDPLIPFEPQSGVELVSPDIESDGPVLYVMDDTKSFNVLNFKTSPASHTTITARLAYIGTHSQVWVEYGTPTVVIQNELAEDIGTEFDENIYPLVHDNFYSESDVNADGKIAILCFDIQDNYATTNVYTGGYFWGGDLFNQQYSNRMEIFYIDTYPTMGDNPASPDVTTAYSTLAHEFQHMVNFNRNYIVEGSVTMETWLNEALSMASEHMYEGVQEGRIDYYNGSAGIRSGRSLLEWSSSEVLANYSLSYLFSQYLRTQVEQGSDPNVSFFNQIITDDSQGYQAVENVIQNYIDSNMSFGEFMTNFRAAMILKANTGPFGFGGDEDFSGISTPLYTGGTTTLYGGGAIVKSIGTPFSAPGNQGTNINYMGLFKP